jgi:hypothetical protein
MNKNDKPGTERHRDQQRPDRGPVYHGQKDWDLSDEEAPREGLRDDAEKEATTNVEEADEAIADPGTRGAVFGKGGQGQVMRDDEDRDSKKTKAGAHDETGKSPGNRRK